MRLTDTDRGILRLAIPSIASNVTIPLLGLVDLAIVGHMDDLRLIGAVAVGTMVFNVAYWLLGFLRMATSGLTAQALGREDMPLTVALIRQALQSACVLALFLLLLQWPLREAAIWVIAPSPETAPLVRVYFNICIWGAPAVLMSYVVTGWFVGMQDTRTPMIVAISQNVINILLSLFFVYGCHMQLEGVALGTMLAQWCGLFMAGWFCRSRYRHVFRLGTSGKTIAHGHFFRLNAHIFLRTLCLVLVNLSFTAFSARGGDEILAANTLLLTFFTLFSYFLDGFAFAAESLCGKWWGAESRLNFTVTVRRLARWGLMLAVAFTLLYVLGASSFLTLLTSQTEVVAAAAPYVPWVWLIPLCSFSAFVLDGVFIGITASRQMLLSSFIAASLFFLTVFVFSNQWGNHALWVAYLCFLAMRGVIQWSILPRLVKERF